MEEKKEIEGVEPKQSETISFEEHQRILKEKESNTEKGVQKIISEKKNLELVLEELPKVSEDNNYLIELHDNNPVVADLILEKYYGGKTIDDFRSDIGYKEDYNDPKVIEKLIAKKADEIEKKRLFSSRKQEIISQLGWDEEKLAKLDTELSELVDGKQLTKDKYEKYLFIAIREVDNDVNIKELEKLEVMAKLGTVGGFNSGSKPTKGPVNTRAKVITEQSTKFLKDMNII